MFIKQMTPNFAWLWSRLGPRQPSRPAKLATAQPFLGLAFLVLVPAGWFFFSSRRRHTISLRDWSSDVSLPICRDEFALLGRTFNQMAFQLQTRLDELEAERGRLRDVTSRFSEALGATHDAELLMRLVVEAAMEATNAAGGVIVGTSGSLVKAGFPDKGAERLEVPLQAGSIS